MRKETKGQILAKVQWSWKIGCNLIIPSGCLFSAGQNGPRANLTQPTKKGIALHTGEKHKALFCPPPDIGTIPDSISPDVDAALSTMGGSSASYWIIGQMLRLDASTCTQKIPKPSLFILVITSSTHSSLF